MPTPTPRVFLSYSTADRDLVDPLKDALARAGAEVWLDHERLTPGTPNWQVAVRTGIAQATVVIYVASETAAVSSYVFDEINIARNQAKPVIPFWVRGKDWHDCVPIGWGATQYTDGRGASYTSGVAQLLQALGLAASSPSVAPASAPAPAPVPPASQPALPGSPALHLTPKTLYDLGFQGRAINGVEVVLPPTCPVPAGPFTMGSDKKRDPQANDDEMPQYLIETGAFSIAKFPVTVAEYACAVRAKAVREPPKAGNADWATQLKRLDHPVVCVSWQDAVTYAAWLARATGQPWRLPTEAEWEKAARGTDGRIYPWGNIFDKARCNTSESKLGTTTLVGRYPNGASPCGAQDMAGNVWEWTSSLFIPYPYKQNDGREDRDSTGNRVLRGGSWDYSARSARTAYRNEVRPDYFYRVRGVRLLRAAAGS